MKSNQWWNYVQRVTGVSEKRAIADRVGIDSSNLTRWSQGTRPEAPFAIKFARAYNRPPIEALYEAGHLSKEEANLHEVRIGLADLTTMELIEEVAQRVAAAKLR